MKKIYINRKFFTIIKNVVNNETNWIRNLSVSFSLFLDTWSSKSDNWVELRYTHVELSSRNVKPHDVLTVRHIHPDAAHNWNRKILRINRNGWEFHYLSNEFCLNWIFDDTFIERVFFHVSTGYSRRNGIRFMEMQNTTGTR